MAVDKVKENVKEVLERYGYNSARMIEILQDLQDIYSYLPREVLEEVASTLELPLARVYHIATFFKAFSLLPRGKHVVQVCTGTACHVKGAYRVLERLSDVLGVPAGKTTKDLQFTLETVNCVGACALGPVVIVDEKYYGHVNPSKVESIIEEYRE